MILLTQSGFFNVELDEILAKAGSESAIKDKVREKISQIESDGFYIDGRCHQGIDFLEPVRNRWREIFEEKGLECPDPAKVYRVEHTYRGMDNIMHQFVHIDPSQFMFSYVDFRHLSPMLRSHKTGRFNHFWGIYVESPELMVHDLIQYDVFRNIWWNVPYNIYDGGYDLLDPDQNRVFSLSGNFATLPHSRGAIFSSIRDMAETAERANDFLLKLAEEKANSARRELEAKENDMWKIRQETVRAKRFYESTLLQDESREILKEVAE